MKNFDNVLLGVVTVAFLVVGISVIFFTYDRVSSTNTCNFNNTVYQNGAEVQGFQEDSKCVCSDGSITCSEETGELKLPDIADFKRTGLNVDIKYVASGSKESLAKSVLKTSFESVSKREDVLKVSIEQEQLCTEDNRVPVQIGMYYVRDDTVYVTNVVNKDKKFSQDCIVLVTYTIPNLKKDSSYKIVYLGEDGNSLNANICNLNGKVYFEGDVYSSTDNCNICTCLGGVSKCSNDRVCLDNQTK